MVYWLLANQQNHMSVQPYFKDLPVSIIHTQTCVIVCIQCINVHPHLSQLLYIHDVEHYVYLSCTKYPEHFIIIYRLNSVAVYVIQYDSTV